MPARDNVIVNRLNKTKVEKEVDHEEVRQERLREAGRQKKAEAIENVSIMGFPESAVESHTCSTTGETGGPPKAGVGEPKEVEAI